MRMLHPIPDPLIAPAAALWRAHFGAWGWPRGVHPGRGIVAVDQAGRVQGVMGLRGAGGGFARSQPPLPRWLFRPGPETADLIIDGLAVAHPRDGTGRALIGHAVALAATTHHPGLRAEVRAANTPALDFYRALGFDPVMRGRFGPPWWGGVIVLRLAA